MPTRSDPGETAERLEPRIAATVRASSTRSDHRFRSCWRGSSPHLGSQVLLQGDRIVVFRVVRAVDQRHTPAARRRHDRLPCVLARVELLGVTPAKRVPFLRVVAEPFPELRAGTSFLEPLVGVELRLGQTARAETLDQDAPAVAPGDRIVSALQRNHHTLWRPVIGAAGRSVTGFDDGFGNTALAPPSDSPLNKASNVG